jgi:hypothetical protein
MQVYREGIDDEDALRIWERFLGERQTTAPVRDPIRFLSKIFNDTPSIDSLLSNTPQLDDAEYDAAVAERQRIIGYRAEGHAEHDVWCLPGCLGKPCPVCEWSYADRETGGMCQWCWEKTGVPS